MSGDEDGREGERLSARRGLRVVPPAEGVRSAAAAPETKAVLDDLKRRRRVPGEKR